MRKHIKRYIPFYLFLGCTVLSGCTNSEVKQMQEEKTTIYVDESFKQLFDTAIPTFDSQNAYGVLMPKYVSEYDALEAFKKGETNTICITRELTENEKSIFKSKNIEATSDYIGKDGISLIVNPENKDSFFTIDEVKRILIGKDSLWKSSGKTINVVFDQSNSSNFYYLLNLVNEKKLSGNISAVKSNEEVIEVVRKKKDVLGIIGSNWISDQRDSTHLKFSEGITVCSIAANEFSDYFQPYQAYIYNDIYPLTRKFYIINKAKYNSVASRFDRWIIGQQGQLLIYKSGLIPASMYQREIQIVQEK